VRNLDFKPVEFSTLKGDVIYGAKYLKQDIVEYSGNPYIEALPRIFTEYEVYSQFSIFPKFDPKEVYSDSLSRQHMIARLKDFIHPLDIHLHIEKKLSICLRHGYLARNPLSQEYYRNLSFINNGMESSHFSSEGNMPKFVRSSASGFSIIGISGIGKTTAIERLLLMYPQVIVHSRYNNSPLTRTQIVWLKLDCPFDGSLKSLCRSFFMAVDDILGTTNYYQKFARLPDVRIHNDDTYDTHCCHPFHRCTRD